MATLDAPQPHAAPADASDDPVLLGVQFDDLGQQHETSVLGMWCFLATEVLFFGGVIAAYTVYRATSPHEFALASRKLLVWAGGINTAVLLCSSLTMALAVNAAQVRNHRLVVRWLLLTMVLEHGLPGDQGVRAELYSWIYREHLDPRLLQSPTCTKVQGARRLRLALPGQVRLQMFFILYFIMTGLHAFHMIVGLALLGTMAYLTHRRWFSGGGGVQIEVTGLYWHFIDIVWIFLYPPALSHRSAIMSETHAQAHVVPLRTNLIVFGALQGLLVLTIVAAYLPLGPLHLATAMLIAVVKAVVVILYFMHVRWSSRLTWVFASAAFVWLAIMLVFTLADYLTRGWLDIPGK